MDSLSQSDMSSHDQSLDISAEVEVISERSSHNQSMDISAELEEISERQPYSCSDCNYITRYKSNLNKHIRRVHQESLPKTSTPLKPKTTTTSVKPKTSSIDFICHSCGKAYKSRFGLELHVKSKHTKEFKYVCNMCNKGYNQRVQFRYHISSHSTVGLDKCKTCRQEFHSNGSLKRHLETCQPKSNTMPFFCDICQVSFPRKYKYDEHRRGKHGERRFMCSSCGKRFACPSKFIPNVVR